MWSCDRHVITSLQVQLDRSLRLAVQWARVDVLRELLQKRENEQLISAGTMSMGERTRLEEHMSDDLQQALQLALEQERHSR